MKKMLVLFTLLALFLLMPFDEANATDTRHYLALAPQGEVYIQKAGSLKQLLLMPTMKIEQGDRIVTYDNSMVTLIAPDTNDQLFLLENTTVIFNELTKDKKNKTDIHVISGFVHVAVTPIQQTGDLFYMTYNNIPIQVKGTNFFIRIDPSSGSATLALLTGLVSYNSDSNGANFIYPGQVFFHSFSTDVPIDSETLMTISFDPSVIQSMLESFQDIKKENEQYIQNWQQIINRAPNLDEPAYLVNSNNFLQIMLELAHTIPNFPEIDFQQINSLVTPLSDEQKKALEEAKRKAEQERLAQLTAEELASLKAQQDNLKAEKEATVKKLAEQKKQQQGSSGSSGSSSSSNTDAKQIQQLKVQISLALKQKSSLLATLEKLRNEHTALQQDFLSLSNLLNELETAKATIATINGQTSKPLTEVYKASPIPLPAVSAEVDYTSYTLTQLQQLNTLLQTELQQLNASTAATIQASTDLQADITAFKSLHGEASQLQQQITEANKQLAQLEAQKTALQQEITALFAEQDELNEQIERLLENKANYESELNDLEALLAELSSLQVAASTQNRLAASSLETLPVTDTNSLSIVELEQLRDRLTTQMAALTATSNELNAYVTALQQQIETFIATHGTAEQLQQAIANTKTAIEEASQIVARQNEITSLQNKKYELMHDIESLSLSRAQLTTKWNTLNELLASLQNLQSQLNTSFILQRPEALLLDDSEMDDLSTLSLAQLTMLRDALQTEITTLTNNKDELNLEIETLHNKIGAFIEEHGTAEQLQQAIADTEAAINEQRQMTTLQQEIGTLTERKQQLEQELAPLYERVTMLEQQLATLHDLQATIADVDEQITQVTAQLNELSENNSTEQITLLQSEVNERQMQLSYTQQLNDFYKRKAHEHDITLPEVETAVKSAQFSRSAVTIVELEQTRDALTQQITLAENSLQSIPNEIISLERDIMSWIEENGTEKVLSQRLTDKRQLLAKLSQQLDELLAADETLLELRTLIENMRSEMERLSELNERYSQAFSDAQIELDFSEMEQPID